MTKEQANCGPIVQRGKNSVHGSVCPSGFHLTVISCIRFIRPFDSLTLATAFQMPYIWDHLEFDRGLSDQTCPSLQSHDSIKNNFLSTPLSQWLSFFSEDMRIGFKAELHSRLSSSRRDDGWRLRGLRHQRPQFQRPLSWNLHRFSIA